MRNLERSSLDFSTGVILFRCGKNAGSGERQFPMDENLSLVLLEVIRRPPAGETRVFPFTESAVQQYFAGGADVFTVRKLMGHASLRTADRG